MRIAFLTPLWPVSLAQNGIATYVDAMRRALEAHGHECIVLTLKALEELQTPNDYEAARPPRSFLSRQLSSMHRAVDGRFFDYRFAQRRVAYAFAELNRVAPVDILETEESFGLSLLAASDSATPPVVIRSHGPHFLIKQSPFDRWDEKRLKEEAKAFRVACSASFPSKALRDAVAARYGVTFDNSACFPNPIDIPPASETWKLDSCDRNTILFVGRFDRLKGGDLVLKAFDGLLERFPDARLIMVGADHGLEDDNGVVRSYPDYVQAYLSEKARARIEFMGRVPREDIPVLRRKALVSLSASRYETFPYAVTEALALGAPTVTSATPGLAEYLIDEQDTLFAPVGDAAVLQQQIEQCLSDPEYAARIGAAGRQTAQRLFSPEATAASAAAFYEQVLAGTHNQKAARA